MYPGMFLFVTSARRVVDQIPAMLGFPFGRRGAGPFMFGSGLPLPLACAEAGSGQQRIDTARAIAIVRRNILTIVLLAFRFLVNGNDQFQFQRAIVSAVRRRCCGSRRCRLLLKINRLSAQGDGLLLDSRCSDADCTLSRPDLVEMNRQCNAASFNRPQGFLLQCCCSSLAVLNPPCGSMRSAGRVEYSGLLSGLRAGHDGFQEANLICPKAARLDGSGSQSSFLRR